MMDSYLKYLSEKGMCPEGESWCPVRKECCMIEQATMDNTEIHLKIMKFFKENPKITDKDVHAFADSIGMDPHEFEGHIYMIMSSFFAAGEALKVGITEDKVDPNELKMGIDVEMEHTTDPEISKRIALDHLAELPDYYTRLAKMEEEGEAAKEESE